VVGLGNNSFGCARRAATGCDTGGIAFGGQALGQPRSEAGSTTQPDASNGPMDCLLPIAGTWRLLHGAMLRAALPCRRFVTSHHALKLVPFVYSDRRTMGMTRSEDDLSWSSWGQRYYAEYR
jgi:hypothetical protein